MFGNAEAVVAADDAVIEQRDVHQAAGPLLFLGHLAIIRAGREIARRMVVNSHHGRGVDAPHPVGTIGGDWPLWGFSAPGTAWRWGAINWACRTL